MRTSLKVDRRRLFAARARDALWKIVLVVCSLYGFFLFSSWTQRVGRVQAPECSVACVCVWREIVEVFVSLRVWCYLCADQSQQASVDQNWTTATRIKHKNSISLCTTTTTTTRRVMNIMMTTTTNTSSNCNIDQNGAYTNSNLTSLHAHTNWREFFRVYPEEANVFVHVIFSY